MAAGPRTPHPWSSKDLRVPSSSVRESEEYHGGGGGALDPGDVVHFPFEGLQTSHAPAPLSLTLKPLTCQVPWLPKGLSPPS